MLTVGLSAAPKAPVVGISTGSSGTSWRNIMIDALKTVGDEYKAAGVIKDYKLVNNVTNGDATEQANIIRDFTAQKVDIILVNPNSPDALKIKRIKEAQDAGILVVSFDATVTAPNVLNVTLDQVPLLQGGGDELDVLRVPRVVIEGHVEDVRRGHGGVEGHDEDARRPALP